MGRRFDRTGADFVRNSQIFIAFTLVMVTGVQNTWAQFSFGPKVVKFSSVWSQDRVTPGDKVALAIVLKIDRKWHINPDKDQVVGTDLFDPFPSVVTVDKLPDGLTLDRIVYPKPHELFVELANAKLMVWEKQTVIHVILNVGDGVKPGKLPVSAAVKYQACDDKTCLPPTTAEVKAVLPVVARGGDKGTDRSKEDLFESIDLVDAPIEPTPKAADGEPWPDPFKSTDVIRVKPVWSLLKARAGDPIALALKVTLRKPYHINPDPKQIKDKDLIPTEVVIGDLPKGLRAGDVQYPKPGLHDAGELLGKIPSYAGEFVFFVPVAVEAETATGKVTVPLTIRIQSCDDEGTCLLPGDFQINVDLEVAAALANIGAPTDPDLFKQFDASVFASMSGTTRTPAGKTEKVSTVETFDAFGLNFTIDASTTSGLILMLLVAALGGVLLNLTPCVLPVIPLKIIGLSQVAGSRGKCFGLGVVMSLGVITFWMVLGILVAALTSFDGPSQLFSYPSFTIGVGVFIAVMAIGMCGLFAVRLPNWVYSINPKHDSVSGSFGFGVMTAVLSTPCTAPFMGTALAWATKQSPAVSLATFAAIGGGMALPYLVLAANPALVQKMPRTGPSSELLKQVMGLGMLSAAAYFIGVGITTLLTPVGQPASQLYWLPVMLLLAATGGWLAIRTVKIATVWRATPVVMVVLGSVLAIATLGEAFVVVQQQGASPDENRSGGDGKHIDWVYYTPESFKKAMDNDQVIVVDFTAEWCLNCKVLERNVLHTADVAKYLRQADVVPMKVDLTVRDGNPGWDFLRDEGYTGPPLLVVFSKDGKRVLKSNAYTIGQVQNAIKDGGSQAVAGLSD